MMPLMKCINVTHRCSNQYRSERLAESELNGYQSTYILYVCNNPGISQDQLARIIYINKSNVTRQLTLLEELGYVERRTGLNDKRVIEVFPTQKALDILPQVRKVLQEWNEYITEDLTDDEKDVLNTLLERVAEKAMHYTENISQIAGREPKPL